jgi:hypothetical protein
LLFTHFANRGILSKHRFLTVLKVMYNHGWQGSLVLKPWVVKAEDFGRYCREWVDTDVVMANACDILVPGYRNDHVINMRLWKAKASRELELGYFNRGDYIRDGRFSRGGRHSLPLPGGGDLLDIEDYIQHTNRHILKIRLISGVGGW